MSKMTQKPYERFISKFCESFQLRSDVSPAIKKKLPQVLKSVVVRELQKSDENMILSIYKLENIDININMENDNVVFINHDNVLFTYIRSPQWTYMWSDKVKNKEIEYDISNFFHFSQQYITRSYMISGLAAIALTYNISVDFRYRSVNNYMHNQRFLLKDEILSKFNVNTEKFTTTSNKEKEVRVWFNLINGLDPYIQRAVFYYLRAIRLRDQGFFEEAITKLDIVAEVCLSLITDRIDHVVKVKNDMSNFLHFDADQLYLIDRLYHLRSVFGAHATVTKWWDFAEIYSQEIDDSFNIIKTLIWKICNIEKQNRSVDNNPISWSDWFFNNSEFIWDAVWFSKLPLTQLSGNNPKLRTRRESI